MRLTELERWLADRGYALESVRGSHRRYRHSQTRYCVTVAVHGGPYTELTPYWVRRVLHDVERMRAVTAHDGSNERWV